MPSVLVIKHVAEVRPYAQSELCCLARQHFRACPTPTPAVTESLIRNVFAFQLFVPERTKTVRVSASTSSSCLSMPPPLPRGPLQVHVPVASLQAMAFAHPVGARRVRRHVGDDNPVIRLSQLRLPDPCISGLQRSLSCYGLLIWLAPRTG